jgi:hypothetical protein
MFNVLQLSISTAPIIVSSHDDMLEAISVARQLNMDKARGVPLNEDFDPILTSPIDSDSDVICFIANPDSLPAPHLNVR